MATFSLSKEASKRLFVRARALVVELIPSWRVVSFFKYSAGKYIGIGLDGNGNGNGNGVTNSPIPRSSLE